MLHDISSWWGLIAKGEGMRMEKVTGGVKLSKGVDNYPDRDVDVKLYHFAGGGHEPKNHRILFNEEIISYIDWLQSDDNSK